MAVLFGSPHASQLQVRAMSEHAVAKRALAEEAASAAVGVSRSDRCLGRRTLLIFRSPAFNFDPVNSPSQQVCCAKWRGGGSVFTPFPS